MVNIVNVALESGNIFSPGCSYKRYKYPSYHTVYTSAQPLDVAAVCDVVNHDNQRIFRDNRDVNTNILDENQVLSGNYFLNPHDILDGHENLIVVFCSNTCVRVQPKTTIVLQLREGFSN